MAAVLDGSKTSTTGLVADYEQCGEDLPRPGTRSTVIDSDVRVVPLADVDLAHAVDEGEGYTTVAQWRAGHETFWHGPEVRAEMGQDFTVDDATPVVLERFRLVKDLREARRSLTVRDVRARPP